MAFQTADQMYRSYMTTGERVLDDLLGGGLEAGIVHLFYGSSSLNDDLLRMAVVAQLDRQHGGLATPVIVLDSINMIDILRLADISSEFDLEPEDVNERIFASRAFNSSQTYDLVMNQLDTLLEQVPAKVLILPGLADIYLHDNATGEGMQQVSHMAYRVMTTTTRKGLTTVVSAASSTRNPNLPSGGRSLAGCAQIHVLVRDTPMRKTYTLAKHPGRPVRTVSVGKSRQMFGTTPPLDWFFPDLGK